MNTKKKRSHSKAAPQEWLSGRRSVLLRPFWLIERVVATKSTTSDSLFLSMLIIAISCPTVKGRFCKNSILFYFFVNWNTVAQPTHIPCFSLVQNRDKRILNAFFVIDNRESDNKKEIHSALSECLAGKCRVDMLLSRKIKSGSIAI